MTLTNHRSPTRLSTRTNWIGRWLGGRTRQTESRSVSARGRSLLRLVGLEDRITPATAALSLGTLTIDYTATGVTAETVTATNNGVNIVLSGNISGSLSNPVGSVSKIVVTDSGGSNNQSITFAGTTGYSLSAGLSCTDIETATISRAINVTGSSTLSITAPRNIVVNAGLTTASGDLTLKANQQVTPSSGTFAGIAVSGATIGSTSGLITLLGRGGDGPNFQFGVYLNTNAIVGQGTSASVTVGGTGGVSSVGGAHYGVLVAATASITSSGGDVSVTGQGGGTASNNSSTGIRLEGGTISAGGLGAVTVIGSGGVNAGAGNNGIHLWNTNSTITSAGGNVIVAGQGGGNGVLHFHRGLVIELGGLISAGGSGSVTVTGTGGGSGTISYGVDVRNANSKITSSGGNVLVIGQGGAAGPVGCHGVLVTDSGTISSGGAGTVTVQGTGGAGPGADNRGVHVGTSGQITSSSGAVQVTAVSGNTTSDALRMETSGVVSSGGTASLTVIADNMNVDITSTIKAGATGTGTATLRQKTNGTAIDLGGADASGILGLTDAELDVVTAGLVQIGDANSGTITVSAAITHGNNLSLTTGAGITANDSVTMAVNKNLTALAFGAINLATTNSDISATGSGSIGLTTERNIALASGSSIISASGAITLSANQQVTPSSGAYIGIDVNTATITTGGGNVVLLGRGGTSGSSENIGIRVRSSGQVSAGGAGTVSIEGKGGTAGFGNHGVYLTLSSQVTSAGGTVSVKGTGGTVGSSNHGIIIDTSSVITSGGLALVSVEGYGGASTTSDNRGVALHNSSITSSGGNVEVKGFGGGATTSGNNYGVTVESAAKITSGGAGKVTVEGTGGVTSGASNHGVFVLNGGTEITSGGGDVKVVGQGGNSGHGVLTTFSAQIKAGGSGSVTVDGTGGTSAGNGVYLQNSTTITSATGKVNVIGRGGAAGSGLGVGVVNGGVISAGGTSSVSVEGYGGGAGSNNWGVYVANTNSKITSNGGNVLVTGIEGSGTNSRALDVITSGSITTATNGGHVTLIGNSMNLAASVSANGSSTVTLRQYSNGVAIDLGSVSDPIGGPLSLTDAELDVVTAGLVQIGDGNTGTITVSAAITHGNNLSLTTGAGITANDSVTMAANKSLTGSAIGTIMLATTNSDVATSGSGSIGLTTERDISLANGSSISSAHGAVTLKANQQVSPTSGSFVGISVFNSSISSTTAAITLLGRGGNSGSNNYGVHIAGSGGVVGGGTLGVLSVTGTGGAGTDHNHGVLVDTAAKITTGGGGVIVNGTGDGSTTHNMGVYVTGANSTIDSGGGNVFVSGNGSASGTNYGLGVYVEFSAVISAGGSGQVMVNGTGKGSGGVGFGVRVGYGGTIKSSGGPVLVIGQGSLTGTGGNFGVAVDSSLGSSKITAGGTGTVTVLGTGGAGGSGNAGIEMESADSQITSSGGIVTVQGTGGTGAGGSHYGVYINTGAQITSGGANVSVTGLDGPGAGSIGIHLITSGAITTATAGGQVTLISNSMNISGTVSANSNSTVTLRQYSNGFAINLGAVTDPLGGPLSLTDAELDMVTAGTIQIGDANSGAITVSSAITRAASTVMGLTTGNSIGFNAGFNSVGGAITLTTVGPITQTAGLVETTGTLTLAAASGQTATFVTIGNKAGSLVIPIGVTCLVNGSFDSSGAVQVAGTLGGNGSVGTTTVTGTGKVAPGTSPGKLTTGNIVFNTGTTLSVELNGTVAGTSYDQLLVNGTVILGGATLAGSVGFTPTVGQVFTIIDNDGTADAVTGTFNGIIEGGTATLGAFNFMVSYIGGDGNDVTLTRLAPPSLSTVTLDDGAGNSIQRSMVKRMIVTFSEPITFTGADAFKVSRSGSSSIPVPTGDVLITTNPLSGLATTVTITFGGPLTESGGSLIDGLYDFTIDATKVTAAGGQLDGNSDTIPGGNYVVTGSVANKYFRYFGDFNGDGQVTQDPDFLEFRNAFGPPSTIFDFDNDGAVDQDDFIKFRNNFSGGP